VFLAEHAEIRGAFIVAFGAWRGSRNRGEYAFPSRRVVEVRWEATTV
jgi:hypothetical protein